MAANQGASGGPTPGGVASDHAGRVVLPARVATTTLQQFNTLRPPLFPIACWRMDDLRFDFDSSFVKPEAQLEFSALAVLWNGAGKPPLSIFGHADPVGDDEYNKKLSGRRATAIYAVLTRKTELWEQLYSQPFEGDNWGTRSVQAMLGALGNDAGPIDGSMGPRTSAAVKDFQSAHGLAADGVPGPQTRSQMFQAYMDALSPGFQLADGDFLGRGQDPDGKGDYQGCSEFNPVLVFSQDQEKQFAQPGRKAERDAANASNRRVVAFLFPSGTKVNPGHWPCPRTKEGTSGCKAMFWPDGDYRRNPQADRREYEHDHNTFACRFYDGMARRSPCEIVRKTLMIRLLDGSKKPIVNAAYRLTIGSFDVRDGTARNLAGQDGWLVEQNVLAPSRCSVAFGAPDIADPAAGLFPYHLEVFLDSDAGDPDETARRQLSNLGYTPDLSLEGAVRGFQNDYKISPVTGQLDALTRVKLTEVHEMTMSSDEV
jgi:hypothetical protein